MLIAGLWKHIGNVFVCSINLKYVILLCEKRFYFCGVNSRKKSSEKIPQKLLKKKKITQKIYKRKKNHQKSSKNTTLKNTHRHTPKNKLQN